MQGVGVHAARFLLERHSKRKGNRENAEKLKFILIMGKNHSQGGQTPGQGHVGAGESPSMEVPKAQRDVALRYPNVASGLAPSSVWDQRSPGGSPSLNYEAITRLEAEI